MMRENMELFNASLGKTGPGPGLSRPVWQVTQVFNWNQMGSEGAAFCKRGGCHTPNRTEVRSMAWQAIAGGAMGVWFYTYDALHRTTDESFEVGWENLKSVASEIAHFSPALLSTRVPDPNVENDPSWLMMRTHRLDNAAATTNTLSLFAVSDGTGGGSVTFRVHLLPAAYAVSSGTAPRPAARLSCPSCAAVAHSGGGGGGDNAGVVAPASRSAERSSTLFISATKPS